MNSCPGSSSFEKREYYPGCSSAVGLVVGYTEGP